MLEFGVKLEVGGEGSGGVRMEFVFFFIIGLWVVGVGKIGLL